MAISDILASIDQDIARLQQARTLLGGGAVAAPKKAAGRPKKVMAEVKKAATAPAAGKPAKKRQLSPEGRKRIAEAVKRRWAAQKAAAK
jgi:mono/diheme cytochrome c family protein